MDFADQVLHVKKLKFKNYENFNITSNKMKILSKVTRNCLVCQFECNGFLKFMTNLSTQL